MLQQTLGQLRALRSYLQLPAAAKAECRSDHRGLPSEDPGIEHAIDEGVAWLSRAQDHSASHDGGVAHHFSRVTGWGTSYPEVTGYIVPTLLEYWKLSGDEAARLRARRMLDWLVSIQLADGGFQGGTIGATPLVPVSFNTGQILLGLVSGVREFGDYWEATYRASDWLVASQDPDGCWRRHQTPFAAPGEKAYDVHAAWALFEVATLAPDRRYAQAALANVRWALSLQRENGWFDKCSLDEPSEPLTHTLGYALRGVLEAYRFTHDAMFLEASRRTADGLLGALLPDGFLPGRLNRNWRGTVSWACLTGSAQIAHCWLLLYQHTGEARYRDAAYAANRYVRRTMKIKGPPETRGAIKGSFPVYGEYGQHQYLSWACKFLIDSCMLEKSVREAECRVPSILG